MPYGGTETISHLPLSLLNRQNRWTTPEVNVHVAN